MKLIIDIQGLQREGNRRRGIGRYITELTKALIYHFPENQYILLTNSSLPNISNDFITEINDKNLDVIYFQSPTVGDVDDRYLGKYSNHWSSVQLRSYSISLFNADVLLITSFFDGFKDNSLIDFDKSFNLPPFVSILYDLIPLIKSNQYLNNDNEYRLFYLNKVNDLSNLDGILTISESSRKEAIQYLKINPDYIFNISSACDEKNFSDLPLKVSDDVKILGKFLLYCGANDSRKNLLSLIEAYSLLPLNLIVKHKLVLTGPYSNDEINLIKEWIIKFEIPFEYIVFLGYVSDTKLSQLYQNCYLFIFPSLHEGFGLPVLEAMNCGAPVISSSLTSLPEIVGDNKFMFDPYNVKDISSLIYKSLTDSDFYKAICDNSVIRKNLFSWKLTAQKVINSLTTILENKSKSLERLDYDLKSLKDTQYNILISNLSNNRLIKLKYNVNLLKLLSAAISKINLQHKQILLRSYLKNNKTLKWSIEGPFDTSYSLAILNRNYAIAMHDYGQSVSLVSTDGLGDFEPNPEFLSKNKIIKHLYNNGKKNENDFFICSRNLYPPRVNDVAGSINILHSYGWEESEFPQKWVKEFNEYLQGVSVMSEQVKKILIDNGVNLPIAVTGLGLDHLSKIETTNDLYIKAKKFKILHISSCFPRKGIDILLKAYKNAFTSNDDVSLIIKTFDNVHNDIDIQLHELRKSYSLFPDVIVIKEDLNENQIKSLYLQADLLVAPSRGEGFGLPIAEAMFLGVPVITTNWGGQLDFVNNHNSWLIDFDFVSTTSHFKLDMSYWAEPSVKHLSSLLKNFPRLSSDEIEKKITNAKNEIEKLKWSKVAYENKKFITNGLFNLRKSSKIGWVSTWNSNCGIASYSRRLTCSFVNEIVKFSPLHETNVQDNVFPSWNFQGNASKNLDLLFSNVISAKITTLVVQFNYGFFDFEQLSLLIKKCSEIEINIIMFLHSTIDPANQKNKNLYTLVEPFKLCKRIFVHSYSDLNRLKRLGLISNVSLFPHGIIDTNFKSESINVILPKSIKSNEFKIASYGYCLPNKGILQLIESIDILRNYDINLKLNLYTSMYNDDYVWFYNKVKNLISKLNLDHLINLYPDYIEETKISQMLSKNDLIVFPYQSSNESSSAAVRDGLSSLKPVLVTPLPIFDDVSNLVDYFPGFSPEELALGLKTCYENQLINSKNISEFEKKRNSQLKYRRFSFLSGRIKNIIQSLELNNI